MQTECIKSLLLLQRCSLSYAKIMQTEYNRACSKLPRCCLSFAKIRIFSDKYRVRISIFFVIGM
ncbi:hypothetical protein E5358_01340 [Palleniella muris]|uniref:Uncharacterized protein n=1 Tax=Palleniella muris TaxID=3038145 RepID=A0AC61QTW7_9BACT|nr:hypothetical protein E5358_01340 [Palleniella muris]